MKIKNVELISLFEQAFVDGPAKNVDEIGTVIQVGDGSCKIYGLLNVVYGELIDFEGGNKGIVLDIDQEFVSVFLLFNSIVVEKEIARRTNKVFKVPVGDQLLGRVINSLGKPLDALGDIKSTQMRSIEVEIASIIERSPVNESLETGVLAVDGLIPIGKGQRELLIGNRNTGKTALAIDTILHQKGKDVICIYVAIGQRQANVARLINLLDKENALEYTVIVNADAGQAVLNQYLAPYVGTTIGEYFREQGKDVLIVYDDLSNHAVAFREMSLLLRRPPGREAYPGDVFYLHSRLLERSGKLINGGSMTALPIIQIQSDDITAYVPTNLISITDGQLFFDTKLFNNGIRPAINIELSVSRVGGAAQTKAIKKVAQSLRLELAQYHDLRAFSQFGTDLDEASQRQLARGALIVELLKQKQFVTYSFVDQTLMLFLLKNNYLNDIPKIQVKDFAVKFTKYIVSAYSTLYQNISDTLDISEETEKELKEIAYNFKKMFFSSDNKK